MKSPKTSRPAIHSALTACMAVAAALVVALNQPGAAPPGAVSQRIVSTDGAPVPAAARAAQTEMRLPEASL